MKLFKPSSKSPFATVLLLTTALTLASCKGGELCGPGSDPVTDSDGDCVDNDTDNCPIDFNGGQVDLDEDGVGVPCDSDDTDDTVALVQELDTNPEQTLLSPRSFFSAYALPLSADSAPRLRLDLNAADCAYYLVSCDGHFLGNLNADANDEASVAFEPGLYGSAGSDVSILNPLGFYGRSFTSCSAFNADAPYPPAIVCHKSSGTQELTGYLTTNDAIQDRVDSCDLLTALGLMHPECDL